MLPTRFLPALCVLLLLAAPLSAVGQASPTWQQHVAYEMDITLLADRHQLVGFQRLTYTNHSPDVLDQVFYHLYFNAFQPNSMMAEQNRHLPDPDARVVPRIWELGPDEIGYHDVLSLTQDGRPVTFEITDTVMRVDLARPIGPGESSVFEMRFRSQVPLQTRRSGRDSRGGGIDYSMAQWYPKMAAYDSRGWHADPYIGREFYAPFGRFDVRLTLPADYVVAATGVLQNPEEIGHGYVDDPAPRPAGQDSLTWHFVAENVHDFAWGADPEYLHDRFDVDGTSIHLFYKPDVADHWRLLRQAMPPLLRYMNARFGPYPWPQFSVVQGGDGGMEYPMMTFVSGYTAGFTRPRTAGSVLGTTIHELAHMWYYGVLGNNEADYSWLDEGFVTYAAEEASAFLYQRRPNHLGSTLSVLALQERGLFERLNTPADWFLTNTGFSTASYSAGGMLVHMLGYVMGEETRDRFLRDYYERFAFRHPNPYDVEKVAEDVSGLRLDWYFEQFTNTTRTLDYAVEDVTSEQRGAVWHTTIDLARRDEVVMPVDLRLTLADGSEQWVTIPLGIMQGHKPVPEDWIVARPWLWTYRTYRLSLDLPERVVEVEIDPLGYTPDRNRLNNTARRPVEARFLRAPRPNWFTYEVGYRPLVQYAHDFGVGVGLQARGTYLFGRHQLTATLKLWPQVLATGGEQPELLPFETDVSFFDGIDYTLRYTNPLRALGPLTMLTLSAEKHLGFMENSVRLSRPLGRWAALNRGATRTVEVALLHQLNPTDRVFKAPDPEITLNPFLREHMAAANVTLAVADGDDRLALTVELGSSLERARTASRLILSAARSARLGPLRGLAQFKVGLGSAQLALHKQYRLGAATYEERWRNAAFRTVAAAFDNPLTQAHFVMPQGPGPVAYLLAESDECGCLVGDARIIGTPTGRHVLAGSLSLSTGPLVRHPWLRPLRIQAFSGIGTTWTRPFLDAPPPADFLADAGLGVSYHAGEAAPLRRWAPQSDVLRQLHLVARFPLWVSDPDLLRPDEDALGFRWLLGIGTDL
ncbi:MAG: M1 family peptidase [Bacteroidetes bacterium]|nr:MAG: M1 family peptidase [Bacteroidota bacterium]